LKERTALVRSVLALFSCMYYILSTVDNIGLINYCTLLHCHLLTKYTSLSVPLDWASLRPAPFTNSPAAQYAVILYRRAPVARLTACVGGLANSLATGQPGHQIGLLRIGMQGHLVGVTYLEKRETSLWCYRQSPDASCGLAPCQGLGELPIPGSSSPTAADGFAMESLRPIIGDLLSDFVIPGVSIAEPN